jgi:hypothetical protein
MLGIVSLFFLKITKGNRKKKPIEALKNTKNPEGSVRYLTKIPIVPNIAIAPPMRSLEKSSLFSINSSLIYIINKSIAQYSKKSNREMK